MSDGTSDQAPSINPPPWTLEQIAQATQGEVFNAQSAPPASIKTLAPLDDDNPNALGFLRSSKLFEDLESTTLAAVLIPKDLLATHAEQLHRTSTPLIAVQSPDYALNTLLSAIHRTLRHDAPLQHTSTDTHIDPSATIDPTASIGPNTVVAPGAIIGKHVRIDSGAYIGTDVHIGSNTHIATGAKVMARCIIGDHCKIHAGVVIGTDGFGYIPAPGGMGILKVPHIGNVTIGHHVEVGANTCIDRGKLGNTTIGHHTKIDNLVQIGHNCKVGQAVIICGHCAIAGSCTIGDGAVIGGAAMMADGLRVGAGAKLGGGTGLMNHVPPKEEWWGIPAQPAREYFRSVSALRKLPAIIKSVKQSMGGLNP